MEHNGFDNFELEFLIIQRTKSFSAERGMIAASGPVSQPEQDPRTESAYVKCFTKLNNQKTVSWVMVNVLTSIVLSVSLNLYYYSHTCFTIQPGVLPLFMMCVMRPYPTLFQRRS